MRADVVVIGGGPVGLMTALHAQRRGLRVRVIEPRRTPHDKACGEGIMPAGLALLAAVGIDPPGYPIAGIRYVSPKHAVAARFSAGAGRGVRRTTLQSCLLRATQQAGVGMHPSSVVGLQQHIRGVRVLLRDGSWLDADYAVGADGLHSTVRRLAGLEQPADGPGGRHGLRRHFAAAPWSDLVEVYWGPNAEAYVTPVSHDLVCVALLCSDRIRFDAHLAEFAPLRHHLGDAPAGSRVSGAGPFRRRSSARTSGRIALVGDAAGYVDAITGEGLTVGWRQSRVLIEAITQGRLSDYEGDWRRIVRRSTVLTTGLLGAATVPALRRYIVPTATRLPRLFGRIVDLVSSG